MFSSSDFPQLLSLFFCTVAFRKERLHCACTIGHSHSFIAVDLELGSTGTITPEKQVCVCFFAPHHTPPELPENRRSCPDSTMLGSAPCYPTGPLPTIWPRGAGTPEWEEREPRMVVHQGPTGSCAQRFVRSGPTHPPPGRGGGAGEPYLGV